MHLKATAMSSTTFQQSRALFIRRWGEMAASWGISRTMAEIHAVLFISPKPLCTDDLMEQLQVSRGNASMNLRQLLNWGLIYRVHRRGDRKEYFVAEDDIWQMFEIITRERRRREIEPIIETIEKCREMLNGRLKGEDDQVRAEIRDYDRRLSEMQGFFTGMNSLFNLLLKAGKSGVGKVLKALTKLKR